MALERSENIAADADLEEVYDTERHLLYGLHSCPRSSVGDWRQARIRVSRRLDGMKTGGSTGNRVQRRPDSLGVATRPTLPLADIRPRSGHQADDHFGPCARRPTV